MRKFLAVLTVAALIPGGLWADEIRGQVTKVDVSKNRLTLMVGDKERIVMVAPKVRVTTMVESRRVFPRRTSMQEYITNLDQLQTGTMVTVMTETQNGMEMATQVQVSEPAGRTTSGGGRMRLFRR